MIKDICVNCGWRKSWCKLLDCRYKPPEIPEPKSCLSCKFYLAEGAECMQGHWIYLKRGWCNCCYERRENQMEPARCADCESFNNAGDCYKKFDTRKPFLPICIGYERRKTMKITLEINDKKMGIAIGSATEAAILKMFKKDLPWPQKGDKCFLMHGPGSISNEEVYGATRRVEVYQKYLSAGNCFPTEAAAKKEREKRLAIQRVKQYIIDNPKYVEVDYGCTIVYRKDKTKFMPLRADIVVEAGVSIFPLMDSCVAELVVLECVEDLKIIYGIK